VAPARGRARLVVRRGGRLYIVCGAGRAARRRPAFIWLPGAALVLVVAFSVFAFVCSPEPPERLQREMPLAQVAHYTAEDFFSSAR
jgi:ribosomal protein L36